MVDHILVLKNLLELRLASLEKIRVAGVIPGILDSIELEELIGRIKELKITLRLLEPINIAMVLNGLKSGLENYVEIILECDNPAP